MGSRQTTNAFSEQGSPHDINNLTSKRTRATIRAQKRTQDPVEPKQEAYGLPSSSQSQNLIQVEIESFDTASRAGSTSTRSRPMRRNKRTQDRALLDETEPSTSASQILSRPNKRRAIRMEEGTSRNEDYPIIFLPPLRNDSPHPTVRRTTETGSIQDSSSYLQSTFNLPNTEDNGIGVTLPPISLPQENSPHGGITLPPIRSVFPIGLERSRTPRNISPDLEVIDLSSPSYRSADPYPSNIVDLTSSPNTHSPAVNPPITNNGIEIIVIDDESEAGSPLPSRTLRGLQLKCAICLDHPKDVSATSCGHIFCLNCITTALKAQKVCSLCRNPLSKKQIKRLEFKISL
ncbi:5333_t:CDS:2 [Funneliformis geosporum]|uniref:11930_t:CDS:1 n=1 Tax=Funneliformis geosporum TaxID=1117311 RepID=A0A9W4SC52_9GLOM|nr:5333_t:CDS:2 [Funneliformis geosporum]CAI2163690.1 11930_t:CDS:2 [Funneliformis geosporum]